MKRQKRKEKITQQRKGQIQEAALAVFSRKGFGEATIPDIAQEAGIAVGTIYNYYRSKRELFIGILGEVFVGAFFVKALEVVDALFGAAGDVLASGILVEDGRGLAMGGGILGSC